MTQSRLNLAFAILMLVGGASLSPTHAHAQTDGRAAPDARKGFQMAIRPNVAIPLGRAFGGVDLTQLSTPLFGIDLDIGWKPTPNLFLGGRPSLGVGGVGDASDFICSVSGATCFATRAGLGVEAHYHFQPGARINPWLGYGFGLDVLSLSRDGVLGRVQSSFYGFDFARLSGGFDWRISRGFGIGLFADFAMGMYFSEVVTVEDDDRRERSASDSIDDTTMHYWLTIGPRFVIFP